MRLYMRTHSGGVWVYMYITRGSNSAIFLFCPLCPVKQVFSSPELAQAELLGYRDVRHTCGRPRHPSGNFLACVHSRGNSFDPKFMKLCQNVNHHNV